VTLARAVEESRTPVELRRRLAAAGPEIVPALFRCLVDDRLPAGTDGAPIALTDETRTVLFESLCERPRREVTAFLEELATRTPTVPERLAAQRVVGRIGAADHARLLVRLTLEADAGAPIAAELRTGFTEAMSAVLMRDGAAVGRTREFLGEGSPRLAGPLVDALATVTTEEATRALSGLLGRSPALDPLILARLAERRRVGARVDPGTAEAVRRYLDHGDPALISAAAHASGELRDDEAVEALVQLVDHPDERVRTSVFGALEKVTGYAFGADAARWTSWYQAEMRWWEEEAEALLVRIERGHGAEFTRAAREAMEHRLFRDRIAEAFAQALRRSNLEEVRLSCRALELLGSSTAVRGLVECLQSDSPAVREAAWQALRAITGDDLPMESDSWSG